MTGRPSKKRAIKAKSQRVYRGRISTRKITPPKPIDKTKNPPSISQRELEVKSGQTDESGQITQRTDNIEPMQEPLIKASDLFTFKKRTLSAEARELLAKIDAGGIPVIITQNLERIAKENGIEVSNQMPPDEIIRRLRNLA